jgi:hypothetical protein
MKTYKIDTVALQRFGNVFTDTNYMAWKDGIATKLKNACQTYGRKFYIMYDISDWDNFQTEMKIDWTNKITGTLALTNSSAYAKQNGKPVMCIWGIASEDRPGNNTSWNDVVNFMKGKGCYVILGVNKSWATNTLSIFTNGNMISPWCVGAYTNNAGADSYANQIATEAATCHNRNQDFLPVVWPGFSWHNWKIKDDGSIPPSNQIKRMHGDFMWRQFYNVRNKNIPSVYVAMFDEVDEATAIMKAAPSSATTPTNQWFLTLNADGTACSSDFYLRLTGDGGDMVKSNAAKVSTHPTPHVVSSSASCHIDTPTANLTTNVGSTVAFAISASDSDGVERVKIFTNGTEVASDSSSPYTFNLTFASEGTFTVTAQVKDLLGNYTASDNSRVITVQEESEAVTLLDEGFEGDFSVNWATIEAWKTNTTYKHSGSRSALADVNANNLYGKTVLNTAPYNTITVSFWYRDDDIDADDDVCLWLYDGAACVNAFELDSTTEDTWLSKTLTYTKASYPQYFKTNFKLRVRGNSIDSGENLWLDDVKVVVE